MAAPQLSFAALLKRLRRAAGLTQEQLAARAGYSVSYLGQLERGVRVPVRATAELLADALGLADPERAELEAATRPGRAAAVPAADPPTVSRAVPGAPDPPLVGRARELIRLGRHLAGDGAPLLLLAGEPGIGKSRLLRETADRARAAGWTVLEGGCTRRSGQEPYAPLLGALARCVAARPPALLRAPDPSLEGCAWLVRLLPELAERAVVPAPAWTLPPEQERRLTFDAVARFLANVAGPAGTLLLLDDLQWAGPDALDLLAALLRAPVAAPRAVGAYRGTEVGAEHALGTLRADLGRAGLADELPVGPLAAGEARALVDGLLPASEGGPSLATRVVERAGAVPFFLVSCARALGDAAADAGAAGAELPWTVQQSVRQRVGTLPEGARALLGLAAVAGRALPRRPLFAAAGAALGADRASLLAAIEAACAAGLLAEDERGDYRFAHDLIREVVLAELGAARRAAWHLAWAETLEAEPAGGRAERAAELAWHFARADEPTRALPYALAAGDRAETVYAHGEAVQHFKGALEVARALGQQGQEASALERLGRALESAGRYDEAIEHIDEASTRYHTTGDMEGVVRTEAQLARLHALRGNAQHGIERIQSALDALRGSRPFPRGLAKLYAGLAGLCYVAARHTDQLIASERAIELADAVHDVPVIGQATMAKGTALIMLGRTQDGMHALDHAVALLETSHDLANLWLALNFRSVGYEDRGAFDEGRREIERALGIAEAVSDPVATTAMLCRRGSFAFHIGEWGDSQRDYERAYALVKQFGPSAVSGIPSLYLGEIWLATGHLDDARKALEEASNISLGAGGVGIHWAVQRLLIEHDLLQGQADSLRARLSTLTEHLARVGNDSTPMLPMIAWACGELGEVLRADDLLQAAITSARDSERRTILADALRIQALLAAPASSDAQEADAALEESLTLCRAMPYPYAEAKGLYVSGQLYAARGEPERARERYEQALAILDRLGERLYAEHVARARAALPAG